MLTRYFSRPIRVYSYAIGEVMSITVFAFTFSVFFGLPVAEGMAKTTAICFMALSAGTFVLSTCLKRIDDAQ